MYMMKALVAHSVTIAVTTQHPSTRRDPEDGNDEFEMIEHRQLHPRDRKMASRHKITKAKPDSYSFGSVWLGGLACRGVVWLAILSGFMMVHGSLQNRWKARSCVAGLMRIEGGEVRYQCRRQDSSEKLVSYWQFSGMIDLGLR